jgi:Flp pilus assembly protein TadD
MRDAEVFARRAALADPELLEAHNVLGVALVNTGRRDEGIESFRTAHRLDPSDRGPARNLVATLCRAGRTDEALSVAQACKGYPFG